MSCSDPGPMDDADRALVRRAKNNDVAAYEALYRRHVGRVFALCRRLTRDQDTAEDLTQDAFVQAWRKLADFRGDSAFGSWLYRIATNLALSYLRSQKNFAQSLVDEDLPEHRETTDLQIGIEQAIAGLPDGARAVFVLYAVEGHTHDEVAALLGIAQGSSKAQLHRARTLLKAALSPGDSNHPEGRGVQ